MAFNRDTSKFYKNITTKSSTWRIELLPYSTVPYSTLTEYELPDFAIYEDFGLDGGFDNNIKIGCPESLELSFKINPEQFTGDFEDVLQWILEAGTEYNAAVLFGSTYSQKVNVTNHWKIYQDGVLKFDGFQNPSAIPYRQTLFLDGQTPTSEIEIKVFDAFKSILANTNIFQVDFDDIIIDDPTTERDVYSSIEINTTDGHKVYSSVLENIGYGTVGDDTIPEQRRIAWDTDIETVFERLSQNILTTYATLYRDPDIYTTGTLYNVFEGFLASHNFYKQDGTTLLTASDLNMIIALANPETDEEIERFYTGKSVFFADSFFDFVKKFATLLLKSARVNISRGDAEPLTILAEAVNEDSGENGIYIVPAEVAISKNPTILHNEKTISFAKINYSPVAETDFETSEERSISTILRQNSFEVDAFLDNWAVSTNSGTEWGDLNDSFKDVVLIPGPNHTQTFFYEDTGTGGTGKVMLKPSNILVYSDIINLTYNGTYETTVEQPTIVDTNLGEGDIQDIREYVNNLQLKDGFSKLWLTAMLGIYGADAKNCVIQLDVNADIADLDFSEMIGQKVTFDITDFVDNNKLLSIVPTGGYLTAITGFDMAKDIISIEITMSGGL